MGRIRFSGPLHDKLTSFLAITSIALGTYARHLAGRRMVPSWSADFEIGVRFWRHQFTKAMRHPDITRGRLILDSLQTETDDTYHVTSQPSAVPKGHWHIPDHTGSDAVILYLHGGGYAFHGAMSVRFAQMLAHHTKLRLFAPDYRLTPEHPHPAQAEDALAAWNHLTHETPAHRIVVIGDSAGGHMALMLLQTLKARGLPQPALCAGLCPWTDIGDRGASLHGNDPYDLVQGWMALRFGQWLDPDGRFGRAALSPIAQDYAGLAPIYLQTGGREILRDMIRDFATVQKERGADVVLDEWPDMPHDFQAYDSYRPASTEALLRLRQVIGQRLGQPIGQTTPDEKLHEW